VDKHNEILLDEVEKLPNKLDVITMAQVSMSALEPFLRDIKVPVYNSGRTAYNKVREILSEL
jgi:hypothetical protein